MGDSFLLLTNVQPSNMTTSLKEGVESLWALVGLAGVQEGIGEDLGAWEEGEEGCSMGGGKAQAGEYKWLIDEKNMIEVE